MLTLIVTKLDLADDDELSRFARLYGGTAQRLVASGLQFFDRAVRQRVATFDLSNEDGLVYQKAAGYTELVSRIFPWLQSRHREHAVLEYLVGVTEGFMEERGITPPQPRQPPAIAFLDLTGSPRSRRSAETEPLPNLPRTLRASCRKQHKRMAAGRSSGSVTASCFTSPTRVEPF